MSIYDDLDDMVIDLLDEFDDRATAMYLSRTTGGAVSGTTGAYVAGTSSTHNVTGVVTPYAQSLIDGSTIMAGDLRVLLTSAVEPLAGDSIVIDSNNYAVVSIRRVKPGSTTMLYIVQVRR